MICRAVRKLSTGHLSMYKRSRLTRDSIVFVHDLKGHPLETWTSGHQADNKRAVSALGRRQYIRSIFRSLPPLPKSDSIQNGTSTRQQQLFWPHDYLTKDIPQARVWTFGYNADVIGGLFQASDKNSVSQHGRNLEVRLERDIDNKVDPSHFEEAESLS